MRRRWRWGCAVYATTYTGIGLGLLAEWANDREPGAGQLDCVLALPFCTLNAVITRRREVVV